MEWNLSNYRVLAFQMHLIGSIWDHLKFEKKNQANTRIRISVIYMSLVYRMSGDKNTVSNLLTTLDIRHVNNQSSKKNKSDTVGLEIQSGTRCTFWISFNSSLTDSKDLWRCLLTLEAYNLQILSCMEILRICEYYHLVENENLNTLVLKIRMNKTKTPKKNQLFPQKIHPIPQQKSPKKNATVFSPFSAFLHISKTSFTLPPTLTNHRK